MEKDSATLSHSISRLLGRTEDAHLDRMERSSHVASDGTKEKRLSSQEEPPQTDSTDAERGSSSLPTEAHQDPCIYPWMQLIRRKSRQEKKRQSKMNFDCTLVKCYAVSDPC